MRARLEKGERVAKQMRDAGFVRPIAYASPIDVQTEHVENVGGEWSPAQHARRTR